MSTGKFADHVSTEQLVEVSAAGAVLEGMLRVPSNATGVILFAHGSGSSRHSPRNQFVARLLRQSGFATLLIDLLTEAEAEQDDLRFDIRLLANRLCAAIDWLANAPETRDLPIGLFGASTGGAAAIAAAARRPLKTYAIVSRGGRPDLAPDSLPIVHCPTLFIVGEKDQTVIELNRKAFHELRVPVKEMVLVPNAGHLFEEPDALEHVADHAIRWFTHYLKMKDDGCGQY